MIYTVVYKDLMKQIKPHILFAKYLQDTGWTWLKMARTDVKVMQIRCENNEFYQVDIPLDRMLGDYLDAMFIAVKTVEEKEHKPLEQVVFRLMYPDSDILKFRIVKEGIEPGNILLDDAVRLYANIKKLIVSAVEGTICQSHVTDRDKEDAITRFISQCRLGQAEIGSYVATLVCPFARSSEHGYK